LSIAARNRSQCRHARLLNAWDHSPATNARTSQDAKAKRTFHSRSYPLSGYSQYSAGAVLATM
jgi:hypothetical protein